MIVFKFYLNVINQHTRIHAMITSTEAQSYRCSKELVRTYWGKNQTALTLNTVFFPKRCTLHDRITLELFFAFLFDWKKKIKMIHNTTPVRKRADLQSYKYAWMLRLNTKVNSCSFQVIWSALQFDCDLILVLINLNLICYYKNIVCEECSAHFSIEFRCANCSDFSKFWTYTTEKIRQKFLQFMLLDIFFVQTWIGALPRLIYLKYSKWPL